jgi:MSHA biogenesis protein MshP
MSRSPSCQRGFTIVSAIFILVVLAALAAFIAVISTTQQIGSALDVQGARAYQAAKAGIEWGTYQVWSSSPASRPVASAACPIAPGLTTTVTFPAAASTLSAFSVTVTCTAKPDGSGGPTVFAITATACNSGGACPGAVGNAGYIERQITVTL